MTRSVVGRLILKDLYLYRWLIAATIVGGLVSVGVALRGGMATNIGGILLVTSLITHGVFLAIHPALVERQSKSLLFILSLPISPMQHTMAKIAASMIAFLIPWSIVTAVLVGIQLRYDASQVAFTGPMMGLLLANFTVLLAIGLATASEVWAVAGIIVTNTSVPIFLSTLLPRVTAGSAGSTCNAGASLTIAGEAAVVVLSLALAASLQARKKDFV